MRANVRTSVSRKSAALAHISCGARLAMALALGVALYAVTGMPAGAQDAGRGVSTHVIPLFPPAGERLQGFARIINRSDRAGTVRIHATDDAGRRRGPVTLSLDAGAVLHLDSGDLEAGDASKGLSEGLGEGSGHWRLELSTALDIEPLAYLRTGDGFLTTMHAVARTVAAGGETVHQVPIFNPASNRREESRLRVANLTDGPVTVTIEGRDDAGEPAPGGEVRLELPGRAARQLSARQLESGDGPALSGRLGDGAGRWRLFVTADGDIEVMSLVRTPTGHLTNLSVSGLRRTGAVVPARHTLPLFPPAGQARQGLARIVNRSDRAGTVRIHGTDDTGRRRGPITLSLEARAVGHFSSEDLERGNASKGLSDGLGRGSGDWRLELVTDLDIDPSAYLRTGDGFFAPMHEVARTVETGGETVHRVPLFNPASERRQVSWLRVANLNDNPVIVTIRGRDDGLGDPEVVRPTEVYEVRLRLAAGAARRLSAQQLETGDGPGLSGYLGEWTGKWQLFVTSEVDEPVPPDEPVFPESDEDWSDEDWYRWHQWHEAWMKWEQYQDWAATAGKDIKVMSLLQSPTGHLSNLSGAPSSRSFEIVPDGPTTVRPLETIELAVPGGLGSSDYTVEMDLSGTGEFPEGDTVEVDGFTTNRDQIIFASPLAQVLPESNESHEFAVRVRRLADRRLSNVLRFSIKDVTVPRHLSGYPTIALEVVLKSLYASSDDPLLTAEAPSMQPGATMAAARTLNLDTAMSDVQAEALLQSMFGVSAVDLAETRRAESQVYLSATRQGAGAYLPLAAGFRTYDARAECEGRLAREWCEAAVGMLDCTFRVFDNNDNDLKASDACMNEGASGMIEGVAKVVQRVTAPIGAFGSRLTKIISSGRSALQGVFNANATGKWAARIFKFGRTLNERPDDADPKRDFVEDEAGKLNLTGDGLKKKFNNGIDALKGVTRLISGRLQQAEKEAGSRNINGKEREAFGTIVNDSDRLHREVEAIEKHKRVYTGEEDPKEAIKKNPNLGSTEVSSRCKAGYEEFVIDAETSTCVFQQLVERNCYAGSRQAGDVDLGGSDACLYYSLDFFQSGGSCRENYDRVYFQGRWTCRWGELGADKPAWYTLHKALEKGAPSGGAKDLSVVVTQTTVTGPEGLSAVGYTVGRIPEPPSNVPPAPDVSGLETGCHGRRDAEGQKNGRWVCVFGSSIEFKTYQSGTLHGPSGEYNRDGQPRGVFGSYENWEKEGVFLVFYDSGSIEFRTYQSGTLHGPSGEYNRDGQPRGVFGSYENWEKEGVFLVFYDSGSIEFKTYQSGTLHGPSGTYNRDGQRDGWFGSYSNGNRSGTWTWYRNGEKRDTERY